MLWDFLLREKVAVFNLFKYSSICNAGIVKDDLKRFTQQRMCEFLPMVLPLRGSRLRIVLLSLFSSTATTVVVAERTEEATSLLDKPIEDACENALPTIDSIYHLTKSCFFPLC